MSTLLTNVAGAIITVVLFLSGNLGLGLVSAVIFGIVAIRMANRERARERREAQRIAELQRPRPRVAGDFDWRQEDVKRGPDGSTP